VADATTWGVDTTTHGALVIIQPVPHLEDLPDFLTIPETAGALHLDRNAVGSAACGQARGSILTTSGTRIGDERARPGRHHQRPSSTTRTPPSRL